MIYVPTHSLARRACILPEFHQSGVVELASDLIDGCIVNEPFGAAVMAEMPTSRWSVWFIGCAGLNSCVVSDRDGNSSR